MPMRPSRQDQQLDFTFLLSGSRPAVADRPVISAGSIEPPWLDHGLGLAGAGTCPEVRTRRGVTCRVRHRALDHILLEDLVLPAELDASAPVSTIDGRLLLTVLDELPLLALIPGAAHIALALRHGEILFGEFRLAGQLPRGKVRLHRIEGLLEAF